jgi:hypothetical protein
VLPHKCPHFDFATWGAQAGTVEGLFWGPHRGKSRGGVLSSTPAILVSSEGAILRETLLRMRLWTSRGSCPHPWRFIWCWGPKVAQHLGGGDLPDTPSTEGAGPHLRESCPFAQGKAPEGPGAGGWLAWSCGESRESPHKPRKERWGREASNLVPVHGRRGGQGQEGPAKRVTPRLVECERW